ncbi:MAG: putative lipid II flippase FtsW [Propionibacteriaceae bacterium]|jgi:cell division protein FtsW|nr:putative lipid II flippase FtsW [Propionibacteriaceae bacterium]
MSDQSEKDTALWRTTLAHPLFDYRVVIATSAVLLTLGLMMVISASSVTAAAQLHDPYYFGKRQIAFAVVGVLGAVFLARSSEKFTRFLGLPALVVAAVLIALTLTGFGVEIGGNRNWVQFGPEFTRFQPSEFAKLAIVLWGAHDLAKRSKVLTDLRHWAMFLAGTLGLVGLVFAQKDAGTALIMAAIVVIVAIVAGAPWRLLMALFVAAIGVVLLMLKMAPFRLQRILAYLDPLSDPYGMNLQPRRGIQALASGGWFGQGLGSSRQKWGLLAEAHNDYIFAIIGEELGLIGTLTVIFLFAALAFSGMRIALKSTSHFSRHVAVGVVAWMTVQSFANVAVATRMIPVLGIPLPMISYGGSSLMANLFAIGLLVGCARREPQAAKALAQQRTKARRQAVIKVSP